MGTNQVLMRKEVGIKIERGVGEERNLPSIKGKDSDF